MHSPAVRYGSRPILETFLSGMETVLELKLRDLDEPLETFLSGMETIFRYAIAAGLVDP